MNEILIQLQLAEWKHIKVKEQALLADVKHIFWYLSLKKQYKKS